jgi:hypothetical protein
MTLSLEAQLNVDTNAEAGAYQSLHLATANHPVTAVQLCPATYTWMSHIFNSEVSSYIYPDASYLQEQRSTSVRHLPCPHTLFISKNDFNGLLNAPTQLTERPTHRQLADLAAVKYKSPNCAMTSYPLSNGPTDMIL